MEKSTVENVKELVKYNNSSIISRKIIENKAGGITIFAFDKDQRLSEHTAPFDASVQIVDGQAEVIIDGNSNILSAGEMIIMPANIPHAVIANTQFKMILTMLKA